MKLLCLLLLIGLASAIPSFSENVEPEALNFGIMDKITDRIIKPYISKIKASLERVRKSLLDKTADMREILEKESDVLIDILKPAFIRIFNILNDMGANTGVFIEAGRTMIKNLVNNMSDIAEEQKMILLSLVEYVVDKIVAILKSRHDNKLEEIQFGALASYESFGIIDRIIDQFVRPITDTIKSVLMRIAKAMLDKTPHLQEMIKREVTDIVNILKPRVVRIMNLLNDIGANVDGLVQSIRTGLRNIVESMTGIAKEQKDALLNIVNHIVDLLLGSVSLDEGSGF